MWRFLDGPIVVIVMYRVGKIYGTLPDIKIFLFRGCNYLPIEGLMILFACHRALDSHDREVL
jgi:hypothetical protein